MSHITDGDLHAYLDQALDAYAPAEAERIRAHLETCSDCAQRLEEERALHQRASGILGGADPGALQLASLEELEARAAATGGRTDNTPRSGFSWRSPSAIGMGWAATIALALWTGYSVKDFAPNPSVRPSPPAVLEPRREMDAVSAAEQPAELDDEADKSPDAKLEAEALELLSSGVAVVRGGAAGSGAAAEFDRDRNLAAVDERTPERTAADPVSPPQVLAGLRADQPEQERQHRIRDEFRPVERAAEQARRVPPPAAPASLTFDDSPANEASRIVGTVVHAETGAPLAGAQVVVEGTAIGALTNEEGRFVIANAPAGDQSVRVVMLGFAQANDTVTIGPDEPADVTFELSPKMMELSGLVVEASRRPEARRELGNTVGRIMGDSVAVASVDSIAAQARALDARSDVISILGANSLALSDDPLVYVDGVLMKIAGTDDLNDDSRPGRETSRLGDLKPNDIQSIEVLKGPVASELYGTAAANGVLLITTKSGSATVSGLEVRRVDLVELPGMGRVTRIVQTLPNGGDLELWPLADTELAAASPGTDPEDRVAQITDYFKNSLPRGWSMVVQEREGGYLVARAPLSEAELEALMERVPDGD